MKKSETVTAVLPENISGTDPAVIAFPKPFRVREWPSDSVTQLIDNAECLPFLSFSSRKTR